jgi:hypothetical protein
MWEISVLLHVVSLTKKNSNYYFFLTFDVSTYLIKDSMSFPGSYANSCMIIGI